ncbi:MAG: N-6 DNA methylase [Eubacteriales bacterium]|nr:N-6 DNA methylase [Eubacteriales bacterium]
MNISQIENNVNELLRLFKKDTFIFDLLLSYGVPRASITRLQKGNMNLSKNTGEVIWKKKLFFKEVYEEDIHNSIDKIKNENKYMIYEPRFVIVTDYKTILAIDTRTSESLDISISDINKHYDFFLPWAGMEKTQLQIENPADVKAAERMARLYDEIKKNNPTSTYYETHRLNVFLSRLLFCFFAEDTGIFKNKLFTKSINSFTQIDGSDLNSYLNKLFEVLDTKTRCNLPVYLKDFPYVNGGLFRDNYNAPLFTKRSREAIIHSGELNWSGINPDIFGSMIQAVVSPEHRSGFGMHYTSVTNIMKVIKPLFLDKLYEEFNKSIDNIHRLNSLNARLSKIKVFDPACGSGNFLIIAYKELRRLEMKIFKQLNKIDKQQSIYYSKISLSQFYGIELDDFAHEVAILSLWLAEHQMNVEFYNEFGNTKPTLPLQDAGRIIQGNAAILSWKDVCPVKEGDEVYILGNPPYLGARLLDKHQKDDMAYTFTGTGIKFNDLDYIACWFYKGAKYIEGLNAKFAFVSTSSICQGAQVSTLFKHILNERLEIEFANQPFKWSNNAKSKAVVSCVIIGIRNKADDFKYIYNDKVRLKVKNISPYLVEGDSIFVLSRSKPISSLPPMSFGNMPNDGGHLLLNQEEYDKIVSSNPKAVEFIRKYLGSREFINRIPRWCIWLTKMDENNSIQIPEIESRINKVQEHRLKSERESTRNLSYVPYRFAEVRHRNTDAIIIPRHSSELREYIPMGFLNRDTIIGDSALAIYDSDPWVFGVITSHIHMVWVRSVGGRLESRIRYSADICYNTFPFPEVSKSQKSDITRLVYQVLEERENHSEKTLAQLYDPDKMPQGLRLAHQKLDFAVEKCYRSNPFTNDEERIEHLFKLYEKMIKEKQVK